MESLATARPIPASDSSLLPAMPRLLCFFLLGLSFLGVATTRATAAAKVTDADFKAYRSVRYAEALREARKMFARGDATKIAAAELLPGAALRDAGWTKERFDQVEEAIGGIESALRSAKDGEITAEDLASQLAEYDPTAVATVKKHWTDPDQPSDSQRAEKQVRDEIEAERAGVPPTVGQLAGTWVFDADATVEAMLGGPADDEGKKMAAEIAAKVGKPSYTFGPGDRVEVRSKGPDGQEKIETCTFALDGRTIHFKSEGRKREETLEAGLREGKLVLGTGFGKVAFSRK